VFDVEFSYSVLQHFAKNDVVTALEEAGRTLTPGGRAIIQMPTVLGLRNLLHQARRGFKEPGEFLVRYWGAGELRRAFTAAIGPTTMRVDGFFSLNAQTADLDLLPPHFRAVVRISEALRWLADRVPPLLPFADSLYVEAVTPSAKG
jgi:SAM-dependent methyltransferase